MLALSTSLVGLFHIPTLILAWIFTLAIAGGPLLWRFLNYTPVTRCAVVQAVSNFVATGCWLTFGSAAMNAHERGLISLFTSILAVAFLFAGAAGGSHLIARWCPDEQP
ncbi:hypothetical protein I3J27_14745 [Bradyrhizobium xenonodulans]|uniref:Uncharacterized protein n=1 Tax=Bradyrhizobium xenonodulans TaxID=2736875 RepID=A0ABY7MVP0_9BRAD|nr:hypothetical protein [Bradyrhizobium xenonodulans]WBL81609.1 hypothetical protein I3J27_14745 [Bradyrhizobium xenonodulans]